MKRKINHHPLVGLEGLTSPLACHRPKMLKIFARCLTLSSTPFGHPLLCRFLENLCRICAESLLKKRKYLKIKHFRFAFVGITGLEPATSRPPDVCATNCAKSRFCGCKGKAYFWNCKILSQFFYSAHVFSWWNDSSLHDIQLFWLSLRIPIHLITCGSLS